MSMNGALRSVLLSTLGLAVAASLAVVIALRRGPLRFDDIRPNRARILVATCVVLQGAHFIEELATRFYERFPSRLGLVPWSARFFVAFNLFWLFIWALSAMRLRPGARLVVFPLWFLAIAMVLNGIAHPLLAADAGGYFPGLITAPAVGVAGAALWMMLVSLTRRGDETRVRRTQASEAT